MNWLQRTSVGVVLTTACSCQQPSGGTSPTLGGTKHAARRPILDVDFASAAAFERTEKSALLPGARSALASDSASRDGSVLRFFAPGRADLGATEFANPGEHAVEVELLGSSRRFGRYEFDVRFPTCAADEEMVTGLFTYWNEGVDGDGDGIPDASEIDIEHLCGQPEYLWLTVWTDSEESDPPRFHRTSRVVQMRTGAVFETRPGSGEFAELPPKGSLDLQLADFPHPDRYYTFGFEWRETFVRYFFVDGGVERDLWKLVGAGLVPQHEAPVLLNLWHPAEHWMKPGPAAHPRADVELRVDGVRLFH